MHILCALHNKKFDRVNFTRRIGLRERRGLAGDALRIGSMRCLFRCSYSPYISVIRRRI